uniref:DASH complex subunit DAM1 n=1 Tax=Talaromyces marneffei PM1 TaxID=1077442 RepID=A0A093VJ69_TALMA
MDAAAPRSSSRPRPTSRPTTPLRPSSRSSIRNSHGYSGSLSGAGYEEPAINSLEPQFAELADSMADLEANFMHLQLMHESLSRFSESFASFLYGLNMNAFCVDFPEAPIPESFKRAQEAKAQQEQRIRLSLTTPRPRFRLKLHRRREPFHLEGAVVPEVLPAVDMLREDLEQPGVVLVVYHVEAGCRAVGGIVEPYVLNWEVLAYRRYGLGGNRRRPGYLPCIDSPSPDGLTPNSGMSSFLKQTAKLKSR